MGSLRPGKLAILVSQYHDDDVPGPSAAVELNVAGLPEAAAGALQIRQYQIDATHSNAFTTWLHLGSPASPTSGQYAELAAASQLAEIESPPVEHPASGGSTLHFLLPRQAVSLLLLEWRTSRVPKL